MSQERDKRDDDFKVFVGGLSWQMNDADLKDAFAKYDPTSASIVLDKHTNRSRGFGFVWFKDKMGKEDAIRDMHGKELEGRKISCVSAVPMDQTKPGTPAAALGGGEGARTRDYGRYPPRDYGGRDAGRYDRGYDRGYDRPYGGGYDPRYGGYDRGYDRGYGGGYGAPSSRDPYPRDPYGAYGGGGGYHGYDRGYDGYGDRYQPSSHDDRGGPDRRSYGSAPRSSPYDRPPERRPDGRR